MPSIVFVLLRRVAVLSVVWLLLGGAGAVGQISLDATGTYTENFNGLPNILSTSWTNNTTLTGWYAFEEDANTPPTNITVNNGSFSAGSLYSYGVVDSTDRALGSLASGGTDEQTFGLLLQNNTGGNLTSIDIAFTIEQWRYGGSNSNERFQFDYRQYTGATFDSLDIRGNNGSGVAPWVAVSAFDLTTQNTASGSGAYDGNNAANRSLISNTTLTFTTPLADGDQVFLRWFDENDGGSDNGLAIDDLTITWGAACTPPTVNLAYPTEGPANTWVTITGGPFTAGAGITGNSDITFNGVACSAFEVRSDDTLYARAPAAGFGDGIINVTVDACLGASAGTFSELVNVCGSNATDIFISEYIEESGEKYIEIFNGTGASVNLATGNYSIRIYNNGNTTPNSIDNLTGTLADGSTLVFEDNFSNNGCGAFPNSVSQSWNGNDVIELWRGSVVIDRIGPPPGNSSSFAESEVLIKNPAVVSGNVSTSLTDWNNIKASDYTSAPVVCGTNTDLGNHTFTGGGTPPTITTSPADDLDNCPSEDAIFSVVSPQSPKAHQWYVNRFGEATWTLVSATTSDTDTSTIGTLAITPGSLTDYSNDSLQVFVRVDDGTGACNAISSAAIATVLGEGGTPGQWTGTATTGLPTDWANCRNWDDYIVPSDGTNIDISTAAGVPLPNNIPSFNAGFWTIDPLGATPTITLAPSAVVNIPAGTFNNVTVDASAANAIWRYTSSIPANYNESLTYGVRGTLEREVANGNTYPLHLMDAGNTLQRAEMALSSGFPASTVLTAAFETDGTTDAIITTPAGVRDEAGATFDDVVPYAGNSAYWQINTSGATTGLDFDLTLQPQGSFNTALGSAWTIVRRNDGGTTWAFPAGASNTSNTAANVQRTGLTTLSEFTVAYSANPFPVSYLSLGAEWVNEAVAVSWETATEQNNAGFHVQRSVDGTSFQTVGYVAGAGTTTGLETYTFQDPAPLAKVYYYRLLQEDFDGTQALSPVVKVQREAASGAFRLYPNPTSADVQLTWIGGATPKALSVQVTSANGQQLLNLSGASLPDAQAQLQRLSAKLPAGVYTLTLTTFNGPEHLRFVKQ